MILKTIPETNTLAEQFKIEEAQSKLPIQPVKGLWWTAAAFIAFNHIVCLYVLLFTNQLFTVSWPLIFLTLFQAWLNLLGITAGYHRLWSHRSFKACAPLRVVLIILGWCSFQGSCLWWVKKHRLHHRFTDTKFDPYNSTKGFLYAHMLWLFERPIVFTKLQTINLTDLKNDPIVMWQQRNLLAGYVILGAIVPGSIGMLLPDQSFWIGVIWIGAMSRIISWHGIWLVNSASHWKGEQDYTTSESKSTAVKPHWILAILQNGEANHNYHHEFPIDYRHGIKWDDYDPTKWCISFWAWFGWAYDLKQADSHSIKRAEALVTQERASRKKQNTQWPINDDKLPKMSREQFTRKCKEQSLPWMIIDDYVVDVGEFNSHPAGDAILRSQYGRNATKLFHGQLNQHTQSAQLLMKMYAIAKMAKLEDNLTFETNKDNYTVIS